VIQNHSNLGFARANNIGIRASSAALVGLKMI
jgi:GT2 family glycosyltransferase